MGVWYEKPVQASSGWNVVVTAHPGGYADARRILKRHGKTSATQYFNVLVLSVPSVEAFLDTLSEETREDMSLFNAASRVIPGRQIFDFESAEDFEKKACRAVDEMLPRLEGGSFYVRMHRRGFKGQLSSSTEERFLDEYILRRLEDAQRPGRVTFDDPDAIITVETVGPRAALACWSREERERYPFLNLD